MHPTLRPLSLLLALLTGCAVPPPMPADAALVMALPTAPAPRSDRRTCAAILELPEGPTLALQPGARTHLEPVLEHPILGFTVPCGDLTGDGVPEVCGTHGIDVGPADGVLDHLLDAERILAADLDGDAIQELYLIDRGTVTQRRLDGPSPQDLVWPGAPYLVAADPDGDGLDSLWFSERGRVHEIDALDLEAGRSRLSPYRASSLFALQTGDYDRDGELEVALQTEDRILITELDGTRRLQIVPDPREASLALQLVGDGSSTDLLVEVDGGLVQVPAPLGCR